ncbi:MAG TPA: carboxypeptidase regulatory-like domain-containing protein [Terriglobales bacterium]|nr:carboxypeptidase regulatory-like domain-containing protein [Terriglobales bacterium]
MVRMSRWSAAALIPLVLAATMIAQTSKGIIAGTVSDPSGAVIPNAVVSVKNTETGEARQVTSGPTGAYRVEAVNPGRYDIAVSANNFQTITLSRREVVASVITPADVRLAIGARSESVEVVAKNNQVETENGQISHSISNLEIRQLPMATLNPIELALTEPGVSDPVNRGLSNGVNFAVNGQRPRSNNFLIDGQDNNDNFVEGQGFQPTNLQAIQEVSVLTNAYGAEFGRGGASVTNVITRGGTNQFHGDVWEYYQGSGLNAIDASNGLAAGVTPTRPRSNTHTYGFTFGGPVIKNKLFFFFSPQWQRFYGNGTSAQFFAPTAQGIADLNAYGSANATKLTQYFNGLQAPGTGSCVFTRTGSTGNCIHFAQTNVRIVPVKSPDTQHSTRLDYLASQSDIFSLHYVHDSQSITPDFVLNPGSLPGFDSQQGGPAESLGSTWTHTFDPQTVNEFRASWGHFAFAFAPTAEDQSNPLLLMPNIAIAGINPEFPGLGLDTHLPQGREHQTYQFQDAMTLTRGQHMFKGGVDVARLLVKDTNPINTRGILSYTSGGGFTGLGNFLDDFSGASGAGSIAFGNAVVEPKMFQQAYYLQDSWKVRNNLMLDVGVRYEYSNNPENLLGYPAINPAVELTSTDFSARPVREDRNNFAPRFGFAYSPNFLGMFGDGKTVIRGGYGLFYDAFFTNLLDNTASAAPNAVSGLLPATSGGRGIANLSGQLGTIARVLNPRSSVVSVSDSLANPMVHQYNLNVQRELPANMLATIAYVGTHGDKLFASNQLNPPGGSVVSAGGYITGATKPRLNPNRGSITFRDNSASSNYNAAEFKLERRFAKSLMVRGSYTLSRGWDNASEVYLTTGGSPLPQDLLNATNARSEEHGLSSYDATHRYAVAYVYEVPGFTSSNSMLNRVAYLTRGWQWSSTAALQSGLPNTAFIGGIDTNGDGNAFNGRPNVGSANAPAGTTAIDGAFLGAPFLPGTLYDAFSGLPTDAAQVRWLVQPGVGNVQRNSYREPGLVNWNTSVARNFQVPRLGEKSSFQLRADIFNVLNHANEISGLDMNVLDVQDPTNLSAASFANPHYARTGGRTMRLQAKLTF